MFNKSHKHLSLHLMFVLQTWLCADQTFKFCLLQTSVDQFSLSPVCFCWRHIYSCILFGTNGIFMEADLPIRSLYMTDLQTNELSLASYVIPILTFKAGPGQQSQQG